jgi:putative drug exporter of the RND superfamily
MELPLTARNTPFRHRLIGLPSGRRTKWLILAVWLVLIAVAGSFASKLGSVQKNDAKTWLAASAESTKAFDVATQYFGTGNRLPAVIVYARNGALTAADRTKAARDRIALARYAAAPIEPAATARDGRALLLSVPLRSNPNDGSAITNDVKQIRRAVAAHVPTGLAVKVSGPAGIQADVTNVFTGIDTTLLFATIGVVALILLLTYRSPVLWLVPLISVGVGSQLANALVYLLAKYAGLLVNGQSAFILTILVFGVGTDYGLLVIARYREELRRQADRHLAMATALQRAVPAILASATTVALALLCLLSAEMNNTRGLGPVAAIGVLAAFLAMTTLLPALLVIFGRGLFWPFVPRYDAASTFVGREENHGLWGRIAKSVGRRPRAIWVATAFVLVALAFGSTSLSTGLSLQDEFTQKVDSVVGQGLIAAHFPAGASAPLDVYANASAEQPVMTALRHTQGVARLQPAQRSGAWVHISAAPTDPPSSAAARQTVERVRRALHAIPDAGALVGGQTATDLDTDTAYAHDELVAGPLILLVVFVVLAVLLRALVAPLLLLASAALSFLAALGVSALVFQAIGYPRIEQGLPLSGFLFLVALGVDYTIFLITRAREEVADLGHARGILRALVVTGGVITSAGIVLAATFSVGVVLPEVGFLQLSLLVALGVLLDTFVVRTLLVPALALDSGPRFWWPMRLTRPAAGSTSARLKETA